MLSLFGPKLPIDRDELALDAIREEIASATPDQFIRIYEGARASGSC